MNKFTIVDAEQFYVEIEKRFNDLQVSLNKVSFNPSEEVPKVLSKWEEETGMSVATFRKYIRQGVLPVRKMTPTGLLFLYPSDIRKVLKQSTR